MKKALNIIKNILVWLVMIFAVLMMIFTVVSVNTFDRADRNIFGYKAFIVLSDSMKATDFDAGDLVLVKEVDPATLKEGDIIAYTSQNSSNFGETVTHKSRTLTTDDSGAPGFITYGTTTDTDNADEDKKGSPKTFDPGAGIYAVSAALSLTGTVWIGRKRH